MDETPQEILRHRKSNQHQPDRREEHKEYVNNVLISEVIDNKKKCFSRALWLKKNA